MTVTRALAGLILVGALVHRRAEVANLKSALVRRYLAHRALLSRLPFPID